MNARRVLFMTLATGLLFSTPAFAQDEEGDSSRKIQYKSRTEIDFEGVEVSGELIKPAGALLLERKRASFNPLIKLRTDFNEEMDRSVDQIK